MTEKEFKLWQEETARSAHKWQIDAIHNKPEDAIIYKGGVDGHFINIHQNHILVGRYEGAIPHIGEAIFFPAGRIVCVTNNQAWERVFEVGGTEFLRDIIAG